MCHHEGGRQERLVEFGVTLSIMKPRVFIGSSTEGLRVAESLNLRLSEDCETVMWNAGAFQISDTYIESLEKSLADKEFAVLVVTPDDLREMRGEKGSIPRDNVIFELGLFMGRLGRQRTFVVCDPRIVELPSDLEGMKTAKYDSRRSDGDLQNAVLPAATLILHAIRQVPRLAKAPAAKSADRLIADTDALYTALVSWLATEDQEVIIQTPDTTWAWKLVPTLIHWRLKGAMVRVFTAPLSSSTSAARAETARRKLLEDLGCEVRESSEATISGFFRRTQYWDESVAIVVSEQLGSSVPLATKYEGVSDAGAVQALHQMLPPPADSSSKAGAFKPSLIAQDAAEVLDLLKKGVPQYRAAKVTMSETTLATNSLLPLSTYARAYKYVQIERLFSTYEEMQQKPFTAVAVTLRSGKKSILTPPVVEVRKEGPVVIEGTTRAAYCFRNRIADYHCIAVNGVDVDLPGTPVEIANMTISERSLSQRERTEEFQGSLYRQIERAIHPY
jgi:hypothetical protein